MFIFDHGNFHEASILIRREVWLASSFWVIKCGFIFRSYFRLFLCLSCFCFIIETVNFSEKRVFLFKFKRWVIIYIDTNILNFVITIVLSSLLRVSVESSNVQVISKFTLYLIYNDICSLLLSKINTNEISLDLEY